VEERTCLMKGWGGWWCKGGSRGEVGQGVGNAPCGIELGEFYSSEGLGANCLV